MYKHEDKRRPIPTLIHQPSTKHNTVHLNKIREIYLQLPDLSHLKKDYIPTHKELTVKLQSLFPFVNLYPNTYCKKYVDYFTKNMELILNEMLLESDSLKL